MEPLVLASMAGVGIALLSVLTKKRMLATILILIGAALLITQWLVDGYRWQMLGTYGALVVACGVLFASDLRTWVSRLLIATGVLLLVTSVLLTIAFPLWQLHEPAGEFSVGTTYRYLNDETRAEDETSAPSDTRRLGIRIWYPALPATSSTSTLWEPDADRDRMLASALQLPEGFGFLFSHLDLVKTHSVVDAKIAAGQYPVLIFSHGLNFGFSGQNTQLVEYLASQGFVVVAIDHAYWGLHLRFPDGVVADSTGIQNRFAALWKQDNTPEFREATSALEGELDQLTLEGVLQTAVRLRPEASKEQQRGLDVWSQDQRYVLDVLTSYAASDPMFREHLDLDRIGVMGMSYGASAAALTCTQDPRCKALVAIDGFQPVQIDHPAQSVPSLHFSNAKNFMSIHTYYRALSSAYFVQVPDTEHPNFTDVALLSPLLEGMPSILGTAEPNQVLRLVEEFTLAFLERELIKNPSADPGQVATSYPESVFRYQAGKTN